MLVPMLLLCLQEPSLVKTPASAEQLAPPQITTSDLSDHLGFIFAADVGGGRDAIHQQASWFGGIKIGLPVGLRGNPAPIVRTVTLDLGYDRIRGRQGFSGELSMMVPIARFPAPQTPHATYARLYVEPGVGLRIGGGSLGSYASAKAMLVLFSDDRLTSSNAPPSFFVELQRRFPLRAIGRGDTRVVMGLMIAICNHCGLD
jgi:hypothetical protein